MTYRILKLFVIALLMVSAIVVGVMAAAQDVSAEVQAKIDEAMSAAPPFIAQEATILDNARDADAKFVVLREGTNEWSCFPTNSVSRAAPRCYDAVWMNWVYAAGAGDDPSLSVTTPGFAYMLAGGSHASLSDPSLVEPAEGDEWISIPPHVMILLPNSVDISGLAGSTQTSSPWVLYADTPYHIIMIPMEDGEHTGHVDVGS